MSVHGKHMVSFLNKATAFYSQPCKDFFFPSLARLLGSEVFLLRIFSLPFLSARHAQLGHVENVISV